MAKPIHEFFGVIEDADVLSGWNSEGWLLKSCSLLVLDEPFQGVDIKARRDIGNYIRKTSINRATIVFVAELDEALEIADRILVMNEKKLVGEHINKNVDINQILVEIAGKSSLNELGR